MSFQKILTKYRHDSFTERDKGHRFERLMQAYLLTDPTYANKFQNVWLWSDFPYRQDFGGQDTGIDLVAQTNEGDFWAIQCKCFQENTYIDKPAVDSFLATSSRQFVNEDLQTIGFSNRLWIDTTGKKWGSNAEQAIHNQQPPVNRIDLYKLMDAPVDWDKLEQDIHGEAARTPKKSLRPHQQMALDKTHEHFKTHDRGKLIMACGTGKTFNSLRIAEKETDGKGFVLFLVPSIALLGQTLREWSQDAHEPINAVCICSDPKVSKKETKNEDADTFSVVDLALPASTNTKEILKQVTAYRTQTFPNQTFQVSKTWKVLTVVFSTYQSIAVIARVQKELLKHGFGEFDLIICDEAHRTTGVTLAGEDESEFVKVHDNTFLQAKKRLYMTATPRLYSDDSKSKAAENSAVLCSMDDEKLYGQEIYRIGFGEAVARDLLTDYKVLILTLNESNIPPALQALIFDDKKEINTDDAAKLIGCIHALSKHVVGDDGQIKGSDPEPMRRAVAFCQSIKISQKITNTFNATTETYISTLPPEKRDDLVAIGAKHIDGTMSAPERDNLLSWLKAETDDHECRILTNVRCLSEGVDVPSLDAVMFLSARNSQVDVVQSVGRVMRKSPGKKYGYIIIPVIVPANIEADKALDDNERYKVVWTVLNALRAHDDRFNATLNKIELNRKKPDNINVVGVGTTGPGDETSPGDGTKRKKEFAEQIAIKFEELQNAVFARMVLKVGDRRYWEQWAKSVADIADRQIDRINRLISENPDHHQAFAEFLAGLQKNINPSISQAEAVEMLSQHVITKPVFDALFEGYSFVQHNPISVSMQKMLDLLEAGAIEKDTETLDKFYESVKMRASGIDNAEGKQRIIIELYDKFFKTAFPKMVERLGIVYTPVEIVDFIIHSVNDVLRQEFDRSLGDDNVHILDPFTGTGTFITRLIQSGLIPAENLPHKYRREIHANEIVLLAYYIAAVNIENAYHDAIQEIPPSKGVRGMTNRGQGVVNSPIEGGYGVVNSPFESLSPDAFQRGGGQGDDTANIPPSKGVRGMTEGDDSAYEPFNGICLTDTFQLGESDGDDDLFTDHFPQNSERVTRQKKAPLRVIIGNPPYSVGQRSANDNSQNQKYDKLDARIAATYAAATDATNKNSLYDSYIKAFRWSADRLDPQHGGIICFVSNGAWIDGNAQDGFRKILEQEFSSIWVFNLRGNARTQGELRRKEAGTVFGGGSRTPIAITLLVKNPHKIPPSKGAQGDVKATIHYHDIGDYLNREEKLRIIAKFATMTNPNMPWRALTPNEHGDWINKRNDAFESFMAMGDKADKSNQSTFFVPYYSNGLKTQRDAWCYNSSKSDLAQNIQKHLDFYNQQRIAYSEARKKKSNLDVKTFLKRDLKNVSWSRALEWDVEKNKEHQLKDGDFVVAYYRPFFKQNLYFSRALNEMVYQIPKLFPNPAATNRVICVSGVGASKDFSTIITDCLPDIQLQFNGQCFPLYYYEERARQAPTLFDPPADPTGFGNPSGLAPGGQSDYIRRDGVSDFILKRARSQYAHQDPTGFKNPSGLVNKEDIFYYVYGFLHSPAYRTKFANDLKKMLPRLPLVEDVNDFWAFSQAGRELAELHIHYESVPPAPGVLVLYDTIPQEEIEHGLSGDDLKVINYRVEKMRFGKTSSRPVGSRGGEDKSTIIYNSQIRIERIPASAYDYVVNGKSAIEWVMERYQVTTHKDSGITNDPNDWADEVGNPRYILDLLLSVINVSVQTVEIVAGLPEVGFGE